MNPQIRVCAYILVMQCFICVTYMIILCSGNPTTREITTNHEKRSLFHDVLQSLRIHSLPNNVNQEDNKLTQNYERYDFQKEEHLPSDVEFLPRRNDRIEMPSLKYRYPKSVENNTSERGVIDIPKEEVIVYIDTNKSPKTTTQKPKKDKRTRPTDKNKYANKNKDNEDATNEADAFGYVTMSNTMAGQSQIGNRESQTVIKPTVIVNLRGTISHRDSDISLQRKNNRTRIDIPRNIFNINQEINLEKGGEIREPNNLKQGVKVVVDEGRMKVGKGVMIYENAPLENVDNGKENRKFDNVLQILFSI